MTALIQLAFENWRRRRDERRDRRLLTGDELLRAIRVSWEL